MNLLIQKMRVTNPAHSLHSLIEGAASESPALFFEDQVVTFGHMRQRAAALAAGLSARGLHRGDRLALWLDNGIDWIVVVLACSKLGIGVVMLNVRWSAKEVGDMLTRTRSKAIVTSSTQREGACAVALQDMHPATRASLGLVILVDEGDDTFAFGVDQVRLSALEQTGGVDVSDGQPGDEALILATSGTTSSPKLIVHEQASVCRHAADVARASGLHEEGVRMMLAVPMCGAYGYTILISALQAQCPIVLMQAFRPAEAAELIHRHAVTHMLGTNDMLDKLLDRSERSPAFPTLRLFGYASFVPSLTQLPEKAERRGIRIRGFYGMSELLAGFAIQPDDAPLHQRAEGGGQPASDLACFVVRHPESGETVPRGEVGELQVQTPNKLRGYLDDQRTTAAAFTEDGFFRTGDLAYELPDGCFVFVSRMNDVLRIGGYLVAPAEIEDVLAEDSDFAAVQVVATRMSAGVRPIAFVVMRPSMPLDEAAAIARCRRKLAIYKVPARVFAIDEIPMVRSANGQKFKRSELRALAEKLIFAEDRT
ncbi:AMP-binding protein [Variovorax sp. LT1R20]|uniref:AMP-binding protein n=1 Tax=Variovorax sp. LT1R20 TaxID=3443729 RepID=UPI003F44A342